MDVFFYESKFSTIKKTGYFQVSSTCLPLNTTSLMSVENFLKKNREKWLKVGKNALILQVEK